MTTFVKPGSSSRYAKPTRAVHVEDQPCPDRDGNHRLTNDRDGVTTCRGCGVGWDVLDEALNVRVERL